MRSFTRLLLALAAVFLFAMPARAAFHLYVLAELYSSADGSVQFIRLFSPFDFQQFVAGQTVTFTNGTVTNTFTFPSNVGSPTANTHILIATSNFAAQAGGVTPDFIIPQNFMRVDGGTVTFSGGTQITFTHLPTNGQLSINASNQTAINTPQNFAHATGSVNVPGGSCCNGATCSLTLQSACGGTFALGGVCTPNPCGGAPTGRCCDANGGCTVVVQASCSGTWTSGGNCSPNLCPQPGICCNGVNCTFVLQSACTGTFSAGSGCVASSCQGLGACCFGVACRMDTAANCVGPRTVFTGAGACNASAAATVPCCRADYDHSGGLSVGDIFDYLNNWFAGSLDCDYNGNGTGQPSVASIFSFINAWFAGC